LAGVRRQRSRREGRRGTGGHARRCRSTRILRVGDLRFGGVDKRIGRGEGSAMLTGEGGWKRRVSAKDCHTGSLREAAKKREEAEGSFATNSRATASSIYKKVELSRTKKTLAATQQVHVLIQGGACPLRQPAFCSSENSRTKPDRAYIKKTEIDFGGLTDILSRAQQQQRRSTRGLSWPYTPTPRQNLCDSKRIPGRRAGVLDRFSLCDLKRV